MVSPIDDELFQLYTQYQLCKVEKDKTLCSNDIEKNAIINILSEFKHVNGNLLHSVFNDMFQNSVQMGCFSERNSAIFNEFVQNTGPRQVNNAITEKAETADQIKGLVDSTVDEDNDGVKSIYLSDTSDSEWNERTSDTDQPALKTLGSRRRKRRRGGKQPANKSTIRKILPHESFRATSNLLENVELSKSQLGSRIKVINHSFKIKQSFPTEASTFHVIEKFEQRSYLANCQENLIAYKIGKLIQREDEPLAQRKKQYYNDAMRKVQNFDLFLDHDFSLFTGYCERMVEMVERIGVFSIFIPEILPPTRIKTTNSSDFVKIYNYLQDHCHQFKDVARFDENGELITAN